MLLGEGFSPRGEEEEQVWLAGGEGLSPRGKRGLEEDKEPPLVDLRVVWFLALCALGGIGFGLARDYEKVAPEVCDPELISKHLHCVDSATSFSTQLALIGAKKEHPYCKLGFENLRTRCPQPNTCACVTSRAHPARHTNLTASVCPWLDADRARTANLTNSVSLSPHVEAPAVPEDLQTKAMVDGQNTADHTRRSSNGARNAASADRKDGEERLNTHSLSSDWSLASKLNARSRR